MPHFIAGVFDAPYQSEGHYVLACRLMSLGLQPNSPGFILPAILVGCAVLGITIFGGYALLFSTAPMVRIYMKLRRWIEGSLACLFGYAGLRLLLSRI